jgi:chemotaxis protein methyltransferase CheR
MSGADLNLRLAIRKRTGVVIEEDRSYLIESRLNDLMRDYRFDSYDDLARAFEASADSALVNQVVDRITTHETSFFRDESVFDALVLQAIPEWFQKRSLSPAQIGEARLDIWSAGCATGQEPYSIAIMIAEKFPQLLTNTRIHATDISPPTIARAQHGAFTQFEIERGMPERLREKHFHRAGDVWRINPNLQTLVRFQTHNLIADEYPGVYDIIFCRNVCIYFSEEERRRVFQRMARCLKPDGVLFLGSSESLGAYYTDYVVRECGLARYFEMNNSTVTMFTQKNREGKGT